MIQTVDHGWAIHNWGLTEFEIVTFMWVADLTITITLLVWGANNEKK